MLNILLTNATIKNGNRGCVALALSSIYLIDEIMKERNIKYKIFLPDSGYDDMQKREINNLEYYSCLNISFKDFVKNIKRVKNFKESISIFKNTDFMLDIGQGDSFADIYGVQRFNSIHLKYLLAKRYNIPYCILPQTIGPYKDLKIRTKAFKAIERAKSVMVRDRQSFDYITQYLPDKQVTEVVDVAFFMPYTKKVFDSKYIHVGLNISALLWHGGYTQDNQFGLIVNYQKLVYDIISYFLTIPNVILHLIPHVVGAERDVENDYAISYDIQQEIDNKRVVLAPLFLDPITAKSYISGMDFFMGARMHATIAAFSTGVPVMPMAYSRKFNGLFVDTLKYSDMCDMKSESNDIILDKVNSAFVHRVELKDIIINRMSTTVTDGKKKIKSELVSFFNL